MDKSSPALVILVAVILTSFASIGIILIILYLIKHDSPPTQTSNIIIAPNDLNEECFVENLDDDTSTFRKSTTTINVTHRPIDNNDNNNENVNNLNINNIYSTNSNAYLRPKSFVKTKPNLSSFRNSWINICNPKPTTSMTNSNKILNSSNNTHSIYRPLSIVPPIPNGNTLGLPLSVRPIQSSINEGNESNSNSYLNVHEDVDFANQILDRKSKVMSIVNENNNNDHHQYPPNLNNVNHNFNHRLSFVQGDDSNIII